MTIDQTGLNGTFDLVVEWEYKPRPSPATPPDTQPLQAEVVGTTLPEAMEKQLGLKLQQTTAPLQVLIVDHVAMPSAD